MPKGNSPYARFFRSLIVICLWMGGASAYAESPHLLFYLPDSPPQGIKSGEKKGIMADVALEAARRAGYSAETDILPWPRVLDKVKYGKNLLIVGLSRFPSREESYTWIFPVFTLTRSFVTTGQQINSYSEGKSALSKIAAHYGSMEITMLRSEGFAENQLSFITTNTPLLKFLLRGRVDALYRPVIEVKWLARGDPEAKRLVYGAPMQATEQYIACSRDCDPIIVSSLREALAAMKADGTIEKILKCYE